MAASSIPRVTFNNGRSCPIFGLGTWLSKPNEVNEAVKIEIDCGYRHIDCAFAYGNEHEVGDAIAEKVKEGVITREDLFITSKLWLTYFRPDLVVGAVKKSLQDLKLDYLDLYLLHWPVTLKEGGEPVPKDADGNTMFSDVDYLDTWKVMESLVDQGLVKSIGLSNFNLDQLKRVVSNARICPANLQCEMHPYLTQKPLLEYCKSKGIVMTAYSPLGAPSRPLQSSNDPHLLSDPTVGAIAEKKGKLPAHILIRYHIQNGNIVIPKSVTKSRIESNIEVFDFTLTAQEMEQLEGLNRNFHFLFFPAIKLHPNYPFKELL